MTHVFLTIAVIVLLAPAAAAVPQETPGGTVWNFDDAEAGQPPPHFSFGLTGGGAEGRWVVQEEEDAPSPHRVLAQLDADNTDYRFPVAVADEPAFTDVVLSVRCKLISGEVDQAAGLVFRYRDADNYYVTRANALEDNVRLYTVRDGRRRQIAGWNGRVTQGAWHDYRVEVRGDHMEVYWDGEKVIDFRDSTFPEGGLVGVWTKADSVTWFDNLRAVAPAP